MIGKDFIHRILPENVFARNMSVLLGGTASAQFLTILAMPLLTRLYNPEDFGMLAVYVSLLSLTGVVSSLCYELAIPLPEDGIDAVNIAVLSLILVAIFTCFTSISVVLFSKPIAELLDLPRLAEYLWLLPIAVMFRGIYTVFNYWGIREKHFSSISIAKLSQTLTILAIQLTTFKLGGAVLLFAQTVGQGVGSIRLAYSAFSNFDFHLVNWNGIRRVAKRYRRFPIFSTWSALANTAGLHLPTVMFATFFGLTAAGLYSISHRVLSIPISLIGSTIGQVFLSHGVGARNNEELGEVVIKLYSDLAQLGLPPVIVVLVSGPDLFSFVFGESWREAGVIAQWIAPWLYLSFITTPLSSLFTIRERQDQGLYFQIILLLSRVMGIGVGVYYESFTMAVVCFSVMSAIVRVYLLVLLLKDFYERKWHIIIPAVEAGRWSLITVFPLIVYQYVSIKDELMWFCAALLTFFFVVIRYNSIKGTLFHV